MERIGHSWRFCRQGQSKSTMKQRLSLQRKWVTFTPNSRASLLLMTFLTKLALSLNSILIKISQNFLAKQRNSKWLMIRSIRFSLRLFSVFIPTKGLVKTLTTKYLWGKATQLPVSLPTITLSFQKIVFSQMMIVYLWRNLSEDLMNLWSKGLNKRLKRSISKLLSGSWHPSSLRSWKPTLQRYQSFLNYCNKGSLTKTNQ